jgi:hypothetical protein
VPCPCTETFKARARQALGSKNRRPATRYDVGKTTRRPESITERDNLTVGGTALSTLEILAATDLLIDDRTLAVRHYIACVRVVNDRLP